MNSSPSFTPSSRSYLTISVDDGHPSDLRVAELLHGLGLKATFYIPAANPKRPVLRKQSLRMLAEEFELGSHTFSHATLTQLPRERARQEICDGKAWLEDVTGARVDTFCYPRGKFNRAVVELVRDAGFVGARTCMTNLLDRSPNPYLWGASTQAYSHPRAIQTRHAIVEQNWVGLVNFFRVFRAAVEWDEHFDLAAAFVAANGGVAHLWLHGWEIERNDEWAKLLRVLARVREHRLTSVTNGSLFGGG